MKKALVTGAAGFIGSHVVSQLLEKNIEVRAFVKPQENMANIKGLDIEIMKGDILNKQKVEEAIKGVDTIFHLAAIYAIWMEDWKWIYEVNLKGESKYIMGFLKSRPH